MTHNSFKLLWEYLRRPALSADEKAAIRSSLIEAMRSPYAPKKSPYFSSLFSFHYSYVGVFAVAILVFSVSFAAEYSLPGSTLYAVKRNVNEPLIGVVSLSSEGRALWQVSLAERRLSEAAQLLSEDRLSETDTIELGSAIRGNAIAFAAALEGTEADNAAFGISSKFEATLAAHEGFLGALFAKREPVLVAAFSMEDSSRSAGVSAMQVSSDAEMRAAPSVSVSETALMKAAPVSIPGGLVGDIRTAVEKVTEVRTKREEKIKTKSVDALRSVFYERLADIQEEFSEVSADALRLKEIDNASRISEQLNLVQLLLTSAEEVFTRDAVQGLELLREAQSHVVEAEILVRSARSGKSSAEDSSLANISAVSSQQNNRSDKEDGDEAESNNSKDRNRRED